MSKKFMIFEWIKNPLFLRVIILAAALIILSSGLTQDSLWYDETFSVAMTEHSYGEIIELSKTDVHPPFYYLGLKLFRSFLGDSFFSFRLFSVFGVLCLLGLALWPVRRFFGNKLSVIFSLLILFSPAFMVMSREARMYTWVAALVFGAAVYGYGALQEKGIKEWILFGIFTVAASYTHYYGLLAVFFINIILFIYILVKKRELILPFIITVVTAVLAYLPWLFTLVGQFSGVTKSFWISYFKDFYMLICAFVLPFGGQVDYEMPQPVVLVVAAVVLIAVITAVIVGLVTKRKGFFPLMCFLTFIGTLFTAYFISVMVSPVFVSRYLFACLGLYLFVLAYGISLIKIKWLAPVLTAAVVCFSLVFLLPLTIGSPKAAAREAAEALKDKVLPGDLFVHGDQLSLGPFWYYFSENNHFLHISEDVEAMYFDFGAFAPRGRAGNDIKEALQRVRRVWFVDMPNMRKEKLSAGAVTRQGFEWFQKYLTFQADNQFDYFAFRVCGLERKDFPGKVSMSTP